MKFLIYNGSPRKGGNCSVLAKEVKEILRLRGHTFSYLEWDKSISPCIHCGYCFPDRNCFIRDPLHEELIDFNCGLFEGIIVLSPIYFFDVSAETKIFIDRLYSVSLTDKLFGLVLTSGSPFRYGGADIIIEIFKRIDEYCGSHTVTPYNKVTYDGILPLNECDKLGLTKLITDLEETHAETKKENL